MTKLLIGMTGSIGVVLMPSYLIVLRQHFSEMKIIMTHSATQFIPQQTMEMFSDKVYTTEFPISKTNMIHIELARWADIFAVIPASGHILAQAAQGFAGSLLSATILAYKKRVIFFPNMNSEMWKNKALQRNVAQMQEDGHLIINPLERPAFEYASQSIEISHVMPSTESVLSVLKLEQEMNQPELLNT